MKITFARDAEVTGLDFVAGLPCVLETYAAGDGTGAKFKYHKFETDEEAIEFFIKASYALMSLNGWKVTT